MEKHTCNLCFRSFANGRALGGHMRSHVAAAKAAELRQQKKLMLAENNYASSSSTSSAAEGYVLRENPRKSLRVVDPEFSSTFQNHIEAGSSSVIIQDRESDNDSPRAVGAAAAATPQCRRSKRRRRMLAALPDPPEPEPISSVSDTTPEEDVAISLMLLSRDAWRQQIHHHEDGRSLQDYIDNDDDDDGDDEEEKMTGATAAVGKGKGRSKYQCESCHKVFRSYQALGGHRAAHKKTNCCNNKTTTLRIPNHSSDSNADPEAKTHQCPVCFRIFGSGQALGGHKRSHVIAAAAAPSVALAPPSLMVDVPKHNERLFDLNLPASVDEEFEQSAVSDAGFAN